MVEVEYKAIQKLREAGYAVALFSPEELDGVSARDVEDAMVRNGSEAIDDLKFQRGDGEEE